MHCASADAPRQSSHPVPPQDAVDASVGDPDAVIALEIPDDPDGPEVVGTAKMDDLLDDTPAGCTASDSRGRASGGPALRPHAPLRPASTDRQPPVTRRSVRLQPPPRSRPGHRARRPASRALVVPAVGCRQAPVKSFLRQSGRPRWPCRSSPRRAWPSCWRRSGSSGWPRVRDDPQDLLMTAKEHIGRGHVVERFVIPVMVVVFNELTDRLFQLPRVVVVFQLDGLHRLTGWRPLLHRVKNLTSTWTWRPGTLDRLPRRRSVNRSVEGCDDIVIVRLFLVALIQELN